MKLYIAGPMTGIPEFNYPAFHEAAAAWRAAGWTVNNPAEHFGGDQTRSYEEYVDADLDVLATCDAIAMLPGWNGPGARGSVWERAIARKLLKIPVHDATQPFAVFAPHDDGAEIMPVSYDEYRAFKRWQQQGHGVSSRDLMRQPVLEFIEAVLPTPPLTRHPVTGELGRWDSYGQG